MLRTRDGSLRWRPVTRASARPSVALAISAALIATLVSAFGGPAAQVVAAPAGNDQVVAFIARGVGNGHGRGLSQWGAYGRAVNGGQSWTQILDAYYGGTTMGVRTDPELRVRLLDWDNATSLAVISASSQARWQSSINDYGALQAVDTGNNTFNIYSSPTPACPGDAGATFTLVALGQPGPITFSTPVDPAGAAPASVLGVCGAGGSVRHYRGEVSLLDIAGGNRVVNQLDVEQYLRGVIPREVAATWGSAGGGTGMQALMAQAVAARSYGMAQARYTYADTCDSSSCQVYGGAATRPMATSGAAVLEHPLTDQAVAATAGTVRLSGSTIVSTEFSASNGPRTAGGTFPVVDDPWDDVPGNPLHRWTRIIDADAVASTYGLPNADGIATVHDASSIYDGIWSNKLTRNGANLVSALTFRNDFGLPSHGFDLIPITRDVTSSSLFSWIGDSIGTGIATDDSSVFRVLLDGVYPSATYDSITSRRTQGGSVQPDGVGAAGSVPIGTDLVVVELGYNDDGPSMAARIDALMAVLRSRQVGKVAWVNLSERKPQFASVNTAIAAAVNRWSEMVVFDWESASDDFAANRWFNTDNVHLTSTGNAEFALFLRERVLALTGGGSAPRQLVPGVPLQVPVRGQFGVPSSGVVGVALNVTAVGPSGPGFLRVWPCGSPEPQTSSVNFTARGVVEPNAVLVGVDGTGEICVSTLTRTDVLVDVSGWFDDGLQAAGGRLVDTRNLPDGNARSLLPGAPLHVPVLGQFGVPATGVVGVALNVTAVDPSGPGYLRVWPCGSPEPETSSVNFTARGVVEPNAVMVGVDNTGEICVSTLTPTEVLVDVSGWFDSGLKPAGGRLVDTRLLPDGDVRSLLPGTPLHVPVLDRFGVPATGAVGLALNVTAVDPAGPGFLRVWPCGSPEPETSSVNYTARGVIEPNAVVVGLDSTGEVCVSTLTATEVLVDVSGWFDSGLKPAGGRLVDTRNATGPIPGR
jgi:hypothetical protein